MIFHLASTINSTKSKGRGTNEKNREKSIPKLTAIYLNMKLSISFFSSSYFSPLLSSFVQCSFCTAVFIFFLVSIAIAHNWHSVVCRKSIVHFCVPANSKRSNWCTKNDRRNRRQLHSDTTAAAAEVKL